jgi:hypothetical protein
MNTERPTNDLKKQVKGLPIIGRGAFTKCFELNANEVLLLSCDPVKECNAAGWMPKTDRLINLERIDYDGVFALYKAPKMPKFKVGDLSLPEYALFKQVKKFCNSLQWPTNDYPRLYYFRDKLKESELPDDIKELLVDCGEACMNYGPKLGFEFSPRNLSTKGGKIVFLDCFYLWDILQSVRTGRVRV